MTTPLPIIVRPGEVEPRRAFGMAVSLLTVGTQSAGQWLALEYLAPPYGGGLPLHVHRVTTEFIYVLDGTLTVIVAGQAVQLTSGGCAFVPPGVAHGFANQTERPARFLLVASPAGQEGDYAEPGGPESDWPPGESCDLLALLDTYASG